MGTMGSHWFINELASFVGFIPQVNSRRLDFMKQRRFYGKPIFGLLLIISTVVVGADEKQRPLMLFPPDAMEGVQLSSFTFWWDNNNPESQIEEINFSLRESPGGYGSFFIGPWVGDCIFKEYYIGGQRTSFNLSECKGQDLKPNTWYKWQLSLKFVSGEEFGKAAWFKTGPEFISGEVYPTEGVYTRDPSGQIDTLTVSWKAADDTYKKPVKIVIKRDYLPDSEVVLSESTPDDEQETFIIPNVEPAKDWRVWVYYYVLVSDEIKVLDYKVPAHGVIEIR